MKKLTSRLVSSVLTADRRHPERFRPPVPGPEPTARARAAQLQPSRKRLPRMAVVPVPALAILVLLLHAVSSHGKPGQLPGLGGCGADPKSVVVHGGARFTVLSSHVIEIESPPFDDRCESHVAPAVEATVGALTSAPFPSLPHPAIQHLNTHPWWARCCSRHLQPCEPCLGRRSRGAVHLDGSGRPADHLDGGRGPHVQPHRRCQPSPSPTSPASVPGVDPEQHGHPGREWGQSWTRGPRCRLPPPPPPPPPPPNAAPACAPSPPHRTHRSLRSEPPLSVCTHGYTLTTTHAHMGLL